MGKWEMIDVSDALELLSPVFESEEVIWTYFLVQTSVLFVFLNVLKNVKWFFLSHLLCLLTYSMVGISISLLFDPPFLFKLPIANNRNNELLQ